MRRFHFGFLLVAMVLMKCVISTKAEMDACLAEAKKQNVMIIKNYRCAKESGSVTCITENGQVKKLSATCGGKTITTGTGTVTVSDPCLAEAEKQNVKIIKDRNFYRCARGSGSVTCNTMNGKVTKFEATCSNVGGERTTTTATVTESDPCVAEAKKKHVEIKAFGYGCASGSGSVVCNTGNGIVTKFEAKCKTNGAASHLLGLLGLVSFLLVFLCI